MKSNRIYIIKPQKPDGTQAWARGTRGALLIRRRLTRTTGQQWRVYAVKRGTEM